MSHNFAPFPACWLCLTASNFAGDGIKPSSAPSFTNLPIHQSLLYFSLICKKSLDLKETAHPWTGASSSIVPSKSTFVWTAKSTGLYYGMESIYWQFIFNQIFWQYLGILQLLGGLSFGIAFDCFPISLLQIEIIVVMMWKIGTFTGPSQLFSSIPGTKFGGGPGWHRPTLLLSLQSNKSTNFGIIQLIPQIVVNFVADPLEIDLPIKMKICARK